MRSLLLLLFVPFATFAQFSYEIDQSIPVEIDGHSLSLAWAGGLNSAELSKIDLDGDGNEDLVIYDRAAAKVLPYRNVDSKYQYTPDYEVFFPPSVAGWMLLRDFNCDGKKDLFTSDPFGVVVFVNITPPGGQLTWREFNPGFPLLTEGFNGNINLKINDVDIPAIDDVDNDGDLDILSMRFVGIGTVEWHRNMTMERTGRCDSMQLKRITQTYGSVEECICGIFAFGGAPCDYDATPLPRTQHVGGKSLLNIDIDNDGDNDLLYSEETCQSMYIFENVGDKDNALFTHAENFPGSKPASFPLFPAPYFLDVDFDGLSDLVVSPNLYSRTDLNIRVRNSMWLYKNTGTAELPQFTYTKNNFLQEDMIDVGDYSVPTLLDTDNDGDLDLFIGFYGDENFRGSMYFFENVGSPTQPTFKQVDDDYGDLASLSIYNVKPQAVDMNADGRIDLAFTATTVGDDITSLYYIPNSADTGFEPNLTSITRTSVNDLGIQENVFVTDVNRDGIPDLLIGRSTGSLEFWENHSNDGQFSQISRSDGSYLGLEVSTSRQNPSVATLDLDNDGFEDLVMTDQRGGLFIYGDYRGYDPSSSQPTPAPVYNHQLEEFQVPNFGGRVRVALGKIFGSDFPSILVGNTLGGLYVLRNDEGVHLAADPVVGLGPNPLDRGADLQIRSDRNTRVQVFSVLGQKMSDQVFVPANQDFSLPLRELTAGMYVARFTFPGKHVSIKFVIK